MDERITLGHGSGGTRTAELIRDVFARALANPRLDPLDDGALLTDLDGPLAMTTDSFVVSPLQFPGGNIGSLAVHGTVNDLAVSGAVPRYLTLGAILEEGLELSTLTAIVDSMAEAARRCGVQVVTGDTKVVERGKGDGVYLNTAGIGVVREPWRDGPPPMQPGDAILVSGPVGDHGAVILGARMQIDHGPDLVSDSGPVTHLVEALFTEGIVPRFLRDPTRGGLAGVLVDLAEGYGQQVEVEENLIPVRTPTEAVCDLVGVDPLHLACEGRVVAVVEAAHWRRALECWQRCHGGQDAVCIGRLTEGRVGRVVLQTRYGSARQLIRPTAEQLPRIC
jgi:hydrogenase expression/formation protein HypE